MGIPLTPTSRSAAPCLAASLLLTLLFFLRLMFRTSQEDYLETVNQFWRLIVETSCNRKVTPLHALTEKEHSDYGMDTDFAVGTNRVTANKPFGLCAER